MQYPEMDGYSSNSFSEFSGSGSSASFHPPPSETSSSSSVEQTEIEMSSTIYMESNSLEYPTDEVSNEVNVSFIKKIFTFLYILASSRNC